MDRPAPPDRIRTEAGDYLARNADGLARLRQLEARLTDGDLRKPTSNEGWSVAVTLAHLAFWDSYTLARWDRFDRRGAFDEIPDVVWDLVNGAALAQWQALSPRLAARQALQAAEEAVARIRRLPVEAITAANQTKRLFMLDRTVHWYPHLDQIDEAIASGQ